MKKPTRTIFSTPLQWLALLLVAVALGGCGSAGRRDGVPSGRLDANNIADAQPRREPITRAGNKSPYTVLGKTYTLLPTSKGYRVRGIASWYGSKFHGESTANGDTYDAMAMTAAHCTLPIPTYVQVTNLENGRRAIVRVNDRGPFVDNRVIDLSYAAAVKLGYANKGTALVEVAAIDVDNWPPRNDDYIPTAPPLALSNTGKEANTANEARPQPVISTLPQVPIPSAPVSTPAQSTAPLPLGERHYVQVGAFSNFDSAQSLQKQLQQSTGRDVEVQPTATAPVLYRVRVGPLPSRELAEQVRSDLVTNGARDARIVSE